MKRVQQLRNLRNQPSQITVLVRQIPLCDEHKALSCSVDHFFSKYHPHAYHSYQILYGVNHIEVLWTTLVIYKLNIGAKLKARTNCLITRFDGKLQYYWMIFNVTNEALIRGGLCLLRVLINIVLKDMVNRVHFCYHYERWLNWYSKGFIWSWSCGSYEISFSSD